MSFESATIATLEADTALAAIIAKRLNFVTAPQDQRGPYLVLRRVSSDPTLSTDVGQPGASELDRIRLEVACYAKTSALSNSAAAAVRRCLERARPTVYVQVDRLSDYSDLPDLFNTVLEFDCWHPDTIPLD